jgi:cation/acetate symporter
VIAIGAVVAVTLGAIGLGVWGVRLARTTSDLYVASRTITPWWNAAAISGEYLSAASFLGVAGLGMKIGASALWLPVGFAAGYLALLFFVAAPLRRFGAYTIPDFAEARLHSPAMRTVAAIVVLLIGVFYLVPQLKGAGVTLESVAGAPYWVGVVVVGAIVAATVAFGGMRGVTYVQAYQYWVKTFGIALPACLLLIHLGGLPARSALFGQDFPQVPPGGLDVKLSEPRKVEFPERTDYEVDGRPAEAAAGAEVRLPAGTISVPAGVAVPVAVDGDSQIGADWSRPVENSDGPASPVFVYSLLIATFLGTMGLPHILVRFYTNPDGRAARRTTVRVLGLLGLFYLFPPIYGALGRVLTPELYLTGETDSVVLELPQAAWPGLGGEILAALTAAGAFAAFMSTASGLLVSISGTLSYDVRWPRRRVEPAAAAAQPLAPERRMRMFRNAAFAAMLVPAILALGARELDISVLVGWAFALAASTFCPMFLLGVWWRGLTARGAISGIVAGGAVASAGICTTLIAGAQDGVFGAILAQPAVLSVPLAFATMVGVSLRDDRLPADVDAQMLALHAPEELELEAAVSSPAA